MTLDEIQRFIALMDEKGLTGLTVSLGGSTLSLRGSDASATPVERSYPVPVASAPDPLRAPAAGVLRARHPAMRQPPSDRAVRSGEIVAFLQVGPCLRPVTAHAPGRIGAALAEDGTIVGFGQPLFAFAPA